jgi:probable lipoprotein NlpC
MKKILLILFILIGLSSCKSAKNRPKISSRKQPKTEVKQPISQKTAAIIDYAKTFRGVKYKYGGTSKKGMDCSGLIYTSFKKNDIAIPRTTKDLAVSGNWIDIKKNRRRRFAFFCH